MHTPTGELVWQGRAHLGDEPGVFADAFYSGLCLELPLRIQKLGTTTNVTKLILETEHVTTFAGYPGHLIEVVLHEEKPGVPNHWSRRVLTSVRLTSADHDRKELDVDFTDVATPTFISVLVRVDTDVPAGLYNDFVVRRLTNKSQGFVFVASLGF